MEAPAGPATEESRFHHAREEGSRWIARTRDLVAYPQEYGALWALSTLWAQEEHARESTGRTGRKRQKRTLNPAAMILGGPPLLLVVR